MISRGSQPDRNVGRRSWSARPVLVLVGVGLVLVGVVLWSLEREKGGWEGTGLGHHLVSYDEQTGQALVWSEDGEIVFRGNDDTEVEEWIESRRSRDFTVPILMMAGGVLIAAFGITRPSIREQAPSPRPSDAERTDEDPPKAERAV